MSLPTTMRAVRLHDYGGPEVLSVEDVPVPAATSGRVLVRVRATAVNPGEIMIRQGAMAEQAPMEFPFGEGSDLAGAVVGDTEGFADGDAVFGWTDERAAHAEYVSVPAGQLARKPDGASFEQAGSLYVAGGTAWRVVAAARLGDGDTVLVTGAAGGVGSLATQLAIRAGARVIAVAGEGNHKWLRERGAVPVGYGDGLADRVRAAAPGGVDALLDLFGADYVALAQEQLGVAPERSFTVIDFDAVEAGRATVVMGQEVTIDQLAELAGLIAAGDVDLPIAGTFPLDDVRAAYDRLAARHTHGKLVLVP